MRTQLIVIILVSLLQFDNISCQSEYVGNVFPIPLTISNEDPNFEQCPDKNGVYVHTSNCSLFHMCTFGVHRIYSCINGFFFNPISRRCQYLPFEKETKCDIILQTMQDSLVEFIRVSDFNHHRKSATSKCSQPGIYPDILDCSLFHYCHTNKHHQIIKCPNELNFDPKTFLCSSPKLVNCQYEPLFRLEDEANNINSNRYSGILLDTICRDYPIGTYLPMPNHFDEFIICGNDSGSILMKCKSGFIYNALTTACENGPCTFDSTLCENQGQCIDDLTIEKGFKCICSNQYQGEFCENTIKLKETTEQMDSSSDNLLPFDQTTHVPYDEKVELLQYSSNSVQQQQQQPIEPILRIGIVFAASLIGIILFVAIIFGIMSLTHLMCCISAKTVGEWNILRDESNV